MPPRSITLAGWCCVLLSFGSPSTSRAGDLSEAEFRKLHKALRPSPSEAWRTIPWKISLLDAQRVAATQKKPLFIWAMDGHPLGCT
jgi:hypothetical protein